MVTTSADPFSMRWKEVEQWSGSVEEALKRIAVLPDGAGLLVFWRAFKPELAEEPRLIFEQTRRVEGPALESELKRLHADVQQGRSGQSVIFWSGLPTREVLWTAYRWTHEPKKVEAGWQGRADEALDRLRELPEWGPDPLSTHPVEAVWESLSS